MPRTARIDYPGALHHIIGRGINKQPIFLDHTDRELFLDRLSKILTRTATPCYAWALMPNHFHLLLKTAEKSISNLMQRLLTGYAINFNRRHDRCGHLFQNRFKSILCQEDGYLLELVRYIHLNPLRGKLVKDTGELERFRYCGHGAVMGRSSNSWQDTRYVLRLFHHESLVAQGGYGRFVNAGLREGKRAELVEGTLVRRNGEWVAVNLEIGSSSWAGCERILGDDDFVDRVLNRSHEVRAHEHIHAVQEYELEQSAERIASWLGLERSDVLSRGRGRRTTEARGLLCYLIINELGVSQTRLARDLGLSPSTISRAIIRGGTLAKLHGYSLLPEREMPGQINPVLSQGSFL